MEVKRKGSGHRLRGDVSIASEEAQESFMKKAADEGRGLPRVELPSTS